MNSPDDETPLTLDDALQELGRVTLQNKRLHASLEALRENNARAAGVQSEGAGHGPWVWCTRESLARKLTEAQHAEWDDAVRRTPAERRECVSVITRLGNRLGLALPEFPWCRS